MSAIPAASCAAMPARQRPAGVRRAACSLFLAGLVAMAFSAGAQPKYPDRPVRIVVAYAPGGANDLVARLVAQKLGEELGQPVVVENKAGAGGIVGTEAVARAQPDGYTLLLGAGGAITINPSIYPSLPYDPQRDFAPISRVATSALVAVVNPSLPVHSVPELVAWANRQADGISVASPGTGTPLHLAAEMARSMAGFRMTHVPYKGSAPALADLMSGQVDAMFDVVGTSLPHIRSGRLRAIGVTSPARDRSLQDVPTLDEQGLKGFDVTVWYGLFAPAKTPEHVLVRLEAAVRKVVASSDAGERLASMGLSPAADGRDALARQVREEIPLWARVVKESGVKAH
ncbi:MAG: tripartite tricarboxylate transporter substrate binding protein [Lautropia sp.]|nr:MAG: tripartite tricarboxylate transporter substrate binding protein [Pseudomonadota bacterium]MBC6959683.1 tripartite tricarboxylate transporter substrate binding protein [Lautropia sp.]MCL4701571.1 tripartite tricarboxylate transporter substrate binding protein [Burkholderiaceae bacterium]MDL1906209.1 tripartite tricarboxylate transporter substrate binding protein [Betaproteobacteria bacterium PRO1]RIK91526.1 MAG: hypothetical protein DCC70_00775 [Burkholderiales bacterium]